MKKIMLLVSLFCLAVPAAQAAVQGREVNYQADGYTKANTTSRAKARPTGSANMVSIILTQRLLELVVKVVEGAVE